MDVHEAVFTNLDFNVLPLQQQLQLLVQKFVEMEDDIGLLQQIINVTTETLQMGTDAVLLAKFKQDSNVCREENKTETFVTKSVEQDHLIMETTLVTMATMLMEMDVQVIVS